MYDYHCDKCNIDYHSEDMEFILVEVEPGEYGEICPSCKSELTKTFSLDFFK